MDFAPTLVPEGEKAGLDFWLICDQQQAYLFFTSLDGKFWRAETSLDQFPSAGWTKPVVAYQGDIFEASHTYFVPESDKYLTFVEAQGDQKRYFKALVADRLDGTWTELAATRDQPFVSPRNVVNQDESWATSYSHGELLRSGFDQRLEIDLDDLTLLFQGANDQDYRGNEYGLIPWQLGLLSRQEP
jgi:Glycosyl hydrolase family 62